MIRNLRLNRPLFIIICAGLAVLLLAAGLLTWHFLSQPPTPPQATCGYVTFLQGRLQQPLNKDAPQVEQCFYRAYQRCAAVTIYVGEHGVDTGDGTTYWPTMQGNTCQIIAQYSTYGLVSSANHTETSTCQGVVQKNGGLLFLKCDNNGDVFVAG